MESYNSSFDIIKRSEDGKILVVLYENPFVKKDVYFQIDNIKKTFKLMYPNNSVITFEEVNDNILHCLKRKSTVLVVEVADKDGFSNGDIVDSYKMERRA
jgi:hypothetical protein